MKALILEGQAPIEERPLRPADLPEPEPGEKEILIRVEACAVCRTDLHITEGELKAKKSRLVPGHQAVGKVSKLGPGAKRFKEGDLVGAAWLYSSCGACPHCLSGSENLCEKPIFTGYDRDGGYAQFLKAREEFVYPLPSGFDPLQTAPLLCAGIIGYRALKRSSVRPGQRLGLYGFGSSAHVVIQIANHWGCEAYVMTRAEKHRNLAKEMSAFWVGEGKESPPKKLHSSILFAPAGELVPAALEALEKGGTLALAGIHLSDIPSLNYDKHLFYEKNLLSVTANTRQDGRELLDLAQEIPIKTRTEVFSLDQANEALLKLKNDSIEGAAVLKVG